MEGYVQVVKEEKAVGGGARIMKEIYSGDKLRVTQVKQVKREPETKCCMVSANILTLGDLCMLCDIVWREDIFDESSLRLVLARIKEEIENKGILDDADLKQKLKSVARIDLTGGVNEVVIEKLANNRDDKILGAHKFNRPLCYKNLVLKFIKNP